MATPHSTLHSPRINFCFYTSNKTRTDSRKTYYSSVKLRSFTVKNIMNKNIEWFK